MSQNWPWGSQVADKKKIEIQVLIAIFIIWIFFSGNYFLEGGGGVHFRLRKEEFIFQWGTSFSG